MEIRGWSGAEISRHRVDTLEIRKDRTAEAEIFLAIDKTRMEQAIDCALETYQKKEYDTDWIHQRLLSIRVRNELTAE